MQWTWIKQVLWILHEVKWMWKRNIHFCQNFYKNYCLFQGIWKTNLVAIVLPVYNNSSDRCPEDFNNFFLNVDISVNLVFYLAKSAPSLHISCKYILFLVFIYSNLISACRTWVSNPELISDFFNFSHNQTKHFK